MTERTPDSRLVEQDLDQVKDRYGSQAQHYAETRAEAAETAGAEDDADHWQVVADKLEEDEGE